MNKHSDILQDALKSALKGDKEITQEYLREYEDRIGAIAKQIDMLKREMQSLDEEHTAICVVFGAKKK